MGTIRLEFVPIQQFGLGLFGADHLHLVYEDETDLLNAQDYAQDYWLVLEGIRDIGPSGVTVGVLGEEFDTSLAVANNASRDDLVAAIGTPASRGSRIIYTGPDAFDRWSHMADYGVDIQQQQLPYYAASWPFSSLPTINSSSVIATMAWSIFLDVNVLLPFSIRFTTGINTLIGRVDADDITISNNFQTLMTGLGDDSLRGSANTFWVEKFYGGVGDDIVYWSPGENILHGGQPQLSYALDGKDTVDYAGVGVVYIMSPRHAVEHKVPNFIAAHDDGSDQLFSIEQVKWFVGSDVVHVGQGVDLIEKPIKLDLDSANPQGRGDQLGFLDGNSALIINAVGDNLLSIQIAGNEGLDAGYWAESVEWIAGSAMDDRIYTTATTRGSEGGRGNDVIDGRLAAAFTGESPRGYDIELDGGEDDDILVSGTGRTFATGGDGSDTFVLSAMSTESGQVEFVIEDADANDRLALPHAFFKTTRGEFDASELLEIRGAPFKIDDITTESLFVWGPLDDDVVDGYIEFVGQIAFTMEGGDLVITILQGTPLTEARDNGPDEPPGPVTTTIEGEVETAAIVRVLNWQDGDLGITFPLTFDNDVFGTLDSLNDYPGWLSAIQAAVGSALLAPLELRPDAHLPVDLQMAQPMLARFAAFSGDTPTDGDDVIAQPSGGPYQIFALGGDDDITGSDGGDVIDGGIGADTMRGGRGNDTYVVDDVGDTIIEPDRGGFDTVIASIDYTLGVDLEHLTLTGAALFGTGNALRNTIIGNALGNTLAGGDGNDTFAGNLGDDILIGGDGSDGYVYEREDGNDTIIEDADAGAATDVIVFAGGIFGADLTFLRRPSADSDLVIIINGGGTLTISDYFLGDGAGIEGIDFVTGGSWDSATVATYAAAAVVTDNLAPIARDDTFAYLGSGAFTIAMADLLSNDSDRDGGDISIASVHSAVNATVTRDGAGNMRVSPLATPDSVMSFTYVITDSQGAMASADVKIAVQAGADVPVNIAPNAVADSGFSTFAGAALSISASALLANDTDANGDILSITRVTSGSGGAASLMADSSIRFQAAPDFTGQATFTYTADDGNGGTSTASVTVVVNAAEGDPDDDMDGMPDDGGKTLVGNNARNILIGTDYDDIFVGRKGRDKMIGRDGDDLFYVRGRDAIDVFNGGDGYDTIRGSAADDVVRVTSGLGNLISIEAISGGVSGFDILRATSADDILDFSAIKITGIDRIDLGRGDDTVIGSAGNDRLYGGAGRDTFVFAPGGGRDVIEDFAPGHAVGHGWRFGILDALSFERHGADARAGRGDAGDVVDVTGAAFDDAADLWRHMQQSGDDVIITIDAATSVRLKAVTLGQLSADDFQF
ncbi:MAG: cadherin-like domain-containing protein [Hyphomicrobium sp.]